MLQLMEEISTITLDRFQADVLATRAKYERSNANLAGMGVGIITCVPWQLLSQGFEILNSQQCERYQKIIYRPCAGNKRNLRE